MTRVVLILSALVPGLALGGCAVVENGLFGQRERVPAVRDGSDATNPRARPGTAAPEGAATAEALDITSAEERATAVAAAAASGPETDLGTTIASLGAVTEPGIWLKTPLVAAPAKGRVEYPAKGTAVAVDLIPLDAAPRSGSRISLAAMRLIEAELTDLPELRVYRVD